MEQLMLSGFGKTGNWIELNKCTEPGCPKDGEQGAQIFYTVDVHTGTGTFIPRLSRAFGNYPAAVEHFNSLTTVQ